MDLFGTWWKSGVDITIACTLIGKESHQDHPLTSHPIFLFLQLQLSVPPPNALHLSAHLYFLSLISVFSSPFLQYYVFLTCNITTSFKQACQGSSTVTFGRRKTLFSKGRQAGKHVSLSLATLVSRLLRRKIFATLQCYRYINIKTS